MKVDKRVFGTFKGQEIPAIKLTNKNGVSITAIPYGAHIIEWLAPDRDGKFDNITLGFDELEPYFNHHPYYGATVGRVAGRIADGHFSVNGTDYQLEQNQIGKNHIHGGTDGLDNKIWDYEVETDEDEARIIFSYVDADGHNGYPGNLTVSVTYTLTNKDEWKLSYRATTDKATLFNPTNHVYFNLHGDASKNILDHSLFMDADKFVELDNDVIPTGNVLPVDQTPFDFRKTAPIGQAMESDHPQTTLVGGLDHPFVLNHTSDKPDAILLDSTTGRSLRVWTDQDVIVVFTHNGGKENLQIDGVPVGQHSGVTLETQGYPDAVHHEGFGSIILHPGEEFKAETTYQFVLNKDI